MSERNKCTLQVEAKAMEQYSANIADLAKGNMDMYGQYLGSFHASAEAVASKFYAVEAMLRWDALRQVIPSPQEGRQVPPLHPCTQVNSARIRIWRCSRYESRV